MQEVEAMARNHVLERYRTLAAHYLKRARAPSNAVLKSTFSELAGRYQELAARRENRLAKQRTALEAPEAASERRLRAILARTPFLRRYRKSGS